MCSLKLEYYAFLMRFIVFFIIYASAGFSVDKLGNVELASNQSIVLSSPNISVPLNSALSVSAEPTEDTHVVNKRYLDAYVLNATLALGGKYVMASNATDTVTLDCGENYSVRRCSFAHSDNSANSEADVLDEAAKALQGVPFSSSSSIYFDACSATQLGQREISTSFQFSVRAAVVAECARYVFVEM